MNITVTKPNTGVKAKVLAATLEDGTRTELALSGIRFLQIVNANAPEDKAPPFQAKIFVAGRADPVYVRESVKDLRSNECQLVYVGGGKYAVRNNIMRLETISAEQKEVFAAQANASDTAKFKTRVVLTKELGSFWAVKSINELNERGMRFMDIGDGAAVHVMNVKKVAELSDDDRTRISGRYNIDAAGFRGQVTLQGEDRPKLTKLSVAELRSQGIELVDIGEKDYVIRQNVKFFGPFTDEDQARLAQAREGIKAARFVSKVTMANGNGAVLSTKGVDELKAATQAVNIGYDRYVPVSNIAQDKVVAFSKDERSSLSEAGYDVQRAWKSSVALINGMALSPATPEQIKQRCEKALGASGVVPAPDDSRDLDMA